MQGEINDCIKCIKEGGVIAYPTDTVWGLGSDATGKAGVNRIRKIKSRDPRKPMSILVRDIKMAEEYVDLGGYKELLEHTLPGPLTYICKLKKSLPGSDKDTIGVRISPHPFVTEFFEFYDKPIITTSVNLSGERSATSKEELEWLPSDVFIVDWHGGEVSGCESTVVEVIGKDIFIKREGGMGIKALQDISKPFGFSVMLN